MEKVILIALSAFLCAILNEGEQAATFNSAFLEDSKPREHRDGFYSKREGATYDQLAEVRSLSGFMLYHNSTTPSQRQMSN